MRVVYKWLLKVASTLNQSYRIGNSSYTTSILFRRICNINVTATISYKSKSIKQTCESIVSDVTYVVNQWFVYMPNKLFVYTWNLFTNREVDINCSCWQTEHLGNFVMYLYLNDFVSVQTMCIVKCRQNWYFWWRQKQYNYVLVSTWDSYLSFWAKSQQKCTLSLFPYLIQTTFR